MSRRRVARSSRTLVALVGAVAVAAIVVGAAGANITTTTLTTETFTGASTTNTWVLPTPLLEPNDACLTAGSSSTTSVPGCDLATPDDSGSGALQLTPSENSSIGGVFNPTSLPLSGGIDATFDTYQYNGTGSDGISFDFAVTNPQSPAAPTAIGEPGGTLGYTSILTLAGTENPGLPNGYLGFGLDAYGNYEVERVGLNGCGGPGFEPESVTVRGPGDGLNGYCILDSSSANSDTDLPDLHLTLDNQTATSRTNVAVPVEIALNPTDASVTAQESGLPVPAYSWLIAYTPLGATQTAGHWSSTYSLTGTLPTTVSGPGFNSELATTADYPAAWFDPTTGEPYQLSWGIVGTSGSSNEIHDVSGLVVNSLVGPDPQLALAETDNVHGKLIAGNKATYTLTPTVTETADEGDPITLTETFPAGVVPGQATSTSPNWVCGAPDGQTISCIYTPSSTIDAGTTLPPVLVPTSISLTARGSKVAGGEVSSNDAQPATGSDTGAVSVITTKSAPKEAIGGAKITLSVAGLPSSDYGARVTMRKGGKALCTFIYTAKVHSCFVKGLPAGNYTTVTADIGGHGPYAAQNVPVPRFLLNPDAEVIVHYANNSPLLTAATKAQVAYFVKEIKRFQLNKVVVTGYASSTGTPAANKVLARNRANIAAQYLRSVLAKDHITGVRVTVTSKGASDFVASPSSSPLNRRTTLIAT